MIAGRKKLQFGAGNRRKQGRWGCDYAERRGFGENGMVLNLSNETMVIWALCVRVKHLVQYRRRYQQERAQPQDEHQAGRGTFADTALTF